MKIARNAIFYLGVCCMPVLLFTSTICWEVNALRLYEYGFDKYEISQATSIDRLQLKIIAQHLIDYFNLKINTAQIVVGEQGGEFNLFNERELVHLEDVRNLIQLDYWIQRGTLLLLIICLLVLFFGFNAGWRTVVKGLFWGSLVTVGLMSIIALWALFGFERFFLLFHLVSFSNEYWILDPAKDYLIRLFPEGFFYDAALLGFGAIILEALLIGVITFVALRVIGRGKIRGST
ncbi:MAG: TIGR01906 family membrane protein [Chloroflexota bacterium]|nr:MAG: TIGR01906 family membrane protein [Chloroflexota bacterium]